MLTRHTSEGGRRGDRDVWTAFSVLGQWPVRRFKLDRQAFITLSIEV